MVCILYMQRVHSSSNEIDFPCKEKYGMNDNLASQVWDLDIQEESE